MTLDQWAARWGVPLAAIEDLKNYCGMADKPGKPKEGASEAAVQSRVRLRASQMGLRLWRNNNGMCYDVDNNAVRYGLANESQRMNEHIKSSDLIGVRSVLITPDHVGTRVGQFMAREVKRQDWTYKGKPREVAQLNFINLVNSMGGDGAFITDAEELR